MKKLLFGICALLLSVASALGQGINAPAIVPLGQSFGVQHRVGGLYFAPGYATWQALILSGNAASGAQTIIITMGSTGLALADGYNLQPAEAFNTNTPLSIIDANAETVTPTAVTLGNCPAGFLGVGALTQCATVTATFANTHGASALVVSGDGGIFEAFTDAGLQGGGLVYWVVDTGNVTLNTGGLTTTTTTKVPSNFISAGASARVQTTITTTTNWAVGISGSTSAFCTANATLTAGTTCLANMNSPASVGTTQALTAILITCTVANPGAGVVKARIWGYSAVQATQ
jgi:hypothetical protein